MDELGSASTSTTSCAAIACEDRHWQDPRNGGVYTVPRHRYQAHRTQQDARPIAAVGGGICLHLIIATLLACIGCGFPRPQDVECVKPQDCQAGFTCNLTTKSCVTDAGDGGMSADGGTHCKLDDECDTHVCEPIGDCALAQDVLYVDQAGISAGTCTLTAPCEFYYATTQITPQHAILRLANGTYNIDSGLIAGVTVGDVTIVGSRSAILQRATSGPVLEARNGVTLTVRGVSLRRSISCSTFAHLNLSRVSFDNASNDQSPWLNLDNCSAATIADSIFLASPSDGILATAGGDLLLTNTKISGSALNGVNSMGQHLTILGATISDNGDLGIRATVQVLAIHKSAILSNHGGGVSGLGGISDITNNFICRNGNDTSGEFGGLRLDTTLPGNRVIHNTIDRNDSNPLANPRYAGGFFCRGGGSYINNLIVNNFAGSATQLNAQTGGTCDLTGSQVANDDISAHFVSSLTFPFNYHLADASSSAVNAGTAGPAPETEDFDGDPRSDGHPDVGADEFKP